MVPPLVIMGLNIIPLAAYAADVTEVPTDIEATITAQLYVDGETVTASDVSYEASGTDNSGVYAKNGATVTLTNITVTSKSNSSTYDDFPLDASGEYGTNSGVLANGATITLNGGSITTSGLIANGAFATAGGTINISGTADDPFVITVTGYNSHGVDVTDGGTITLSYANISTSGEHASGIATDALGGDAASSITADHCTITTTGEYSSAAYADSNGTITVTNSTLTALQDVGACVAASGVMYLTNCDVTGANAALKVYCPNQAQAGTAVIDGGSLTATTGDAILFSCDTGSVTVQNGTTITAYRGAGGCNKF